MNLESERMLFLTTHIWGAAWVISTPDTKASMISGCLLILYIIISMLVVWGAIRDAIICEIKAPNKNNTNILEE